MPEANSDTDPGVGNTSSGRSALIRAALVVWLFASLCLIYYFKTRLDMASVARARYESPEVSIELAPNERRLISKRIIEANHLEVWNFRIETLRPHIVTVRGGGDVSSRHSQRPDGSHLCFSEIQVSFDHLKEHRLLKTVICAGGKGYSVTDVPADYRLTDNVRIISSTGVTTFADEIELFAAGNVTYTLDVDEVTVK